MAPTAKKTQAPIVVASIGRIPSHEAGYWSRLQVAVQQDRAVHFRAGFAFIHRLAAAIEEATLAKAPGASWIVYPEQQSGRVVVELSVGTETEAVQAREIVLEAIRAADIPSIAA